MFFAILSNKLSIFTTFAKSFPLKFRINFAQLHSRIYKMDKAYMRCPEGSEVFDLSFQYFHPILNINRQFNFSRKLSESVSVFLSRIATNVEKIVNKKQKKKLKSAEESAPLAVKLFQNGDEVCGDLLCESLFKIGGDIRLKILDHEYTIVVNTPWIKNLELPSSILATFPVYPSKFETLFVDKNISDFTWYKSHDQKNWLLAGHGFLFTPCKTDIDYYLKLSCLPKNASDLGPCTEVESAEKIQADPGQCPFDIRHKFAKDKLSGRNFRVVTYNLLADLYADSDYSRTVLFPYCPSYALNIDYRKQLILKELIGYNSDIICLQEVDEKIFNNDLNPVLSTFGFQGIFHKKGGTLREGLACLYNSSRFECIESTSIVLGENVAANPLFSELWSKISKNEKLATRLRERGTTLQITVLQAQENNNNEIIVVANIHLYFHPDADHIRLLQGGISNIYLEDVIQKLKTNYQEKRISLIFCGDFNSVPECGIYKLFTSGSVPEDFLDWNSNAEEAVKDVSLTNNRFLVSACGTPKYTNYTVAFKACLDYIFYEKYNFKVTQVIPLISEEELSTHVAIPSVIIPSDHISLIADLEWL